jgi:hypothetical protein
MMVAAMVAMVLVAATPAFALNPFTFGRTSVNNATGQEDETGNVTLSFSVQQSGNNSNQCVTPQQFANTGSQQNGQSVLQYNSIADGAFGNIEPEGSTFTFAPSETAPCTQQVQQSAAAN